MQLSWLLSAPTNRVGFQSPIHRGDRCNVPHDPAKTVATIAFSPLFIGVIGATCCGPVKVGGYAITFSPLFIGVIGATQSCQVQSAYKHLTFSPLFIGVIGATYAPYVELGTFKIFQSPIHRGDRCNLGAAWCWLRLLPFQSPIHRGDRCNLPISRKNHYRTRPFSPLFIGVIGATPRDHLRRALYCTFSPLFIGVIGATTLSYLYLGLIYNFQSPIHRGDRCNLTPPLFCVGNGRLSVPYSSG